VAKEHVLHAQLSQHPGIALMQVDERADVLQKLALLQTQIDLGNGCRLAAQFIKKHSHQQ
jgi:hypothetical protein